MATATATVTVNNYPGGVDNTQRRTVVNGSIAVQASPATYATNGLALALTGLKSGASDFIQDGGFKPVDPVLINGIAGFIYRYDSAHGTLRIFESAGSAAALAELGNGTAIPAGVSGDTITFRAEYIRDKVV